MNNNYDLTIIGGGTGGYAAAIRASELGLKVALVEKDKIGGTCLHRGCIPAKSLLHSARILDEMENASQFGIEHTKPKINWPKVLSAKEKTVNGLFKGLNSLLSGHRIDIFKGRGQLMPGGNIAVESNGHTSEIASRFAVLATGSRPKTLGYKIDGKFFITSDEALNLTSLPASVVVIGGGAVGLEFASLWRSFGAEVTIVETLPRLLAGEDEEISGYLKKSLENRGITILIDAKLESADLVRGRLSIVVTLAGNKKILKAEKIMIATGRSPVLDGFGVENRNIGAKGFIDVDETLRTSDPRVFAVGDVINTPQFAHVAYAEGIAAAERMAGASPPAPDYKHIPRCVYTSPEIASVGLTEREAVDRGYKIRIAVFPFSADAKAVIIGNTGGFCKMIAEEGGPILGIHMIGPNVTDLISEAMLITNWEALPEEVAGLIHPHPTLPESIGEAAMKLMGKPLSVIV